MGSDSFQVVVEKVEGDRVEDVVYEVGRALDLPRAEAKELVAELPVTLPRSLSRDEADRLRDTLEQAGAVTRVEPAPAGDGEVRPEAGEEPGERDGDEPEDRDEEAGGARGSEPEEDEEDEEEDDYDEEDEEYEEEEDEQEDEGEYDEEDEEQDRERRERLDRRMPRRDRPASQKVMLYGGVGSFVVLLVIMLVLATSGRSCSCGGGQYRGPGGDETLARLLPAVADRFAKGFQPDDAVAHGTLGNGESATLVENVPGGRCYIWIGLSPDGTDLDLFLRDGGEVVAEDQARDNFPVVQHCVAEDTRLELQVAMFQGPAPWVLQRYVLQGSPGADQVQLLHEFYSKRLVANAEPVGPAKRFRLGPGQEVSLDIEFEPEWCYVPLGVSEPGTDLDLYLVDPSGRVVEQDERRDNFPAVRHCPTEPGTYKIRLLMFGGEGDAIFGLYRGKLASGPRTKSGAEIGG